jgi:hypothetical protein
MGRSGTALGEGVVPGCATVAALQLGCGAMHGGDAPNGWGGGACCEPMRISTLVGHVAVRVGISLHGGEHQDVRQQRAKVRYLTFNVDGIIR